MPIQEETIEQVNLATSKYKYGFSTDLEVDKAPKGLDENIIKLISSFKPLGALSTSKSVEKPYLYLDVARLTCSIVSS